MLEGNTELTLKDDGKTTNKTFNFGETIPLIKVTKNTYTDGEYINYTIIDGNNTIEVDMSIQTVHYIHLIICRYQYLVFSKISNIAVSPHY